jgi:uncharacterized protein YqeY
MTVLSDIKTAQLTARKARDTIATDVLTTLLGEVAIVGKNDGNRDTTDTEAVVVVKKFLKNISETTALVTKQGKPTDTLEREAEIVAVFLPTQLTNEQLTSELRKAVSVSGATTMRDMGKVMKIMNADFKGLFDGSQCKPILETMLTH